MEESFLTRLLPGSSLYSDGFLIAHCQYSIIIILVGLGIFGVMLSSDDANKWAVYIIWSLAGLQMLIFIIWFFFQTQIGQKLKRKLLTCCE